MFVVFFSLAFVSLVVLLCLVSVSLSFYFLSLYSVARLVPSTFHQKNLNEEKEGKSITFN